MTDRLRSVLVVLDRDYRDDDAEPILAAIRQIRGVREVAPRVEDAGAYVAVSTARAEVRRQIREAVDAVLDPPDPGRSRR